MVQSVITTLLLAGSSRPILTLYSGLSFKCAAGISASSNADASSSFFWKVSYFRMVFYSFHFLPIFLLAQIL